MKFVNEIYFGENTSLGDGIVISPIVHKYAEYCDVLYYPSNKHFFETLTCLYQDAHNIIVLQETEYYEKRKIAHEYLPTENSVAFVNSVPYKKMKLSFSDGTSVYTNVNFERQVYEHFDLPYSFRYTGFKLPKHIDGSYELYKKLTQGYTEYAVLNPYLGVFNQRVNMDISHLTGNLKIIEITPWITNNMLQYIDLFRNAKQIHTIPTSTFCLLESIQNDLTAELFIHQVRKTFASFIDNKRWTDILYDDNVKLL